LDQPFAGYILRRVIGHGTAGTVYVAEDPPAERLVALKLVRLARSAGSHEAAAVAFERHAAIARRLVHPDIVALHAAGVVEGLAWLAMELVPGSDLGRYTGARRLLPEQVVLQIIRRLALALNHAHGQGVIHRDLKPANVLLHWPSNTVKLADLGLARSGDTHQTDTGVVPGSPSYMAPELLAGAPPTAQSDFYALGVTMFQLLTGRLPHEAASMGELLRTVAESTAPDLLEPRPDLPQSLARLTAGLLARQPSARPADGAAIAAEVDAIRELLPTRPAQAAS
jgi:serine/threonine-protein kinase